MSSWSMNDGSDLTGTITTNTSSGTQMNVAGSGQWELHSVTVGQAQGYDYPLPYRHQAWVHVIEGTETGGVGIHTEKFDLNKDVRFSTYSSWWIKAAMQSFILKNWSIVRIGTTAAQKSLFFKLKSIMTKIEKENNSSFNDYHQQKLANELGVKFKEIEDMKGRLSGSDQSLNATLSENSELETQDLLIDQRPSPEQNAIFTTDSKTISNLINEALNKLPDREKKIIGARQLGENTVTLQELGKDLGISKERVRQLENRALGKLKLSLQSKVNKNDFLLT